MVVQQVVRDIGKTLFLPKASFSNITDNYQFFKKIGFVLQKLVSFLLLLGARYLPIYIVYLPIIFRF